MLKQCLTETSGKGYCREYYQLLTDACARAKKAGKEKEAEEYCSQARQLDHHAPPDTDFDGVADDKDAFPQDALETKDTDKDGIGDNSDDDIDGDGTPNSEDKTATGAPTTEAPQVPEPAPAPAPAPATEPPTTLPPTTTQPPTTEAPATEPPTTAAPVTEPPAQEAAAPASAPAGAPGVWPTTKHDRPLPEQGYNEYFRGKHAQYKQYEHYVGDWGDEWPEVDEGWQESIEKHCAKYKHHPRPQWPDWCQRFAVRASKKGVVWDK